MQFTMNSFALLAFLGLTSAADLALYWGQNSAGVGQQSLGTYCQNSPGDIYLISFVDAFGLGHPLSINVAGYNDYFPGTTLLNAPSLGEDIKICQSLGKKILVSLGGASGQYGFADQANAEQVATDLWNHVGGGSSDIRPFGDAKVDGFDIDSENNMYAANYKYFVDKLRQLYATDPSKQYYVSAAPQCPFPDASVGASLNTADFDFLFVQFYNNYCSLTGSNFNFDTWQDFVTTSSPNKNAKIYVGLPGSSTAAGSGYVTDPAVLKAKMPQLESYPNFGGFMVWDAAQANNNQVGGVSYGQMLKNLLGDSGSASQAPQTTQAPAPVSSAQAPVEVSSAQASVEVSSAQASVEVSSAQASVEVSSAQAPAPEVSTVQAPEVSTIKKAPEASQGPSEVTDVASSQVQAQTQSPASAPAVTTSVSSSNGNVVVVPTTIIESVGPNEYIEKIEDSTTTVFQTVTITETHSPVSPEVEQTAETVTEIPTYTFSVTVSGTGPAPTTSEVTEAVDPEYVTITVGSEVVIYTTEYTTEWVTQWV